MHPRNICKDLESIGSNLTVDGQELYIENDMNVYPELEQVIKEYKSRIIKFLKGEYSEKDHAIKQTIDKTINFYMCVEQDMNAKIGNWLCNDETALNMFMDLLVKFTDNGWFPPESTSNYETVETDKVSKELYERAMSYFKGA
jgi:hypothetical protein